MTEYALNYNPSGAGRKPRPALHTDRPTPRLGRVSPLEPRARDRLPQGVRVDDVLTFLPADQAKGKVNSSVAFSYTLP